MGPRGTSAWTLYSEVRNSGSKRCHSLRGAWVIFPADVEKQCEPERLQADLTLRAPRSRSPVLLSSAERFSGAIRLISGTGWGHRAASGKHSHSSGVALCSWRLSPRTCLSSTHIPVLHCPPLVTPDPAVPVPGRTHLWSRTTAHGEWPWKPGCSSLSHPRDWVSLPSRAARALGAATGFPGRVKAARTNSIFLESTILNNTFVLNA